MRFTPLTAHSLIYQSHSWSRLVFTLCNWKISLEVFQTLMCLVFAAQGICLFLLHFYYISLVVVNHSSNRSFKMPNNQLLELLFPWMLCNISLGLHTKNNLSLSLYLGKSVNLILNWNYNWEDYAVQSRLGAMFFKSSLWIHVAFSL